MKAMDAAKVIDYITQWHSGLKSLSDVAFVLGTDYMRVYNFFLANDLCNIDAKARQHQSPQYTISVLLLYLAMRSKAA